METFNKRLVAIIDETGLRKAAFARELGIEPHGFSSYTKENGSLFGGAILAVFSVKFPQFNIVWLLTGQGEMYNAGFSPPKKSEGSGEVSEEVQAIINSMQTRMDNLESSVRWLMNQMNGSKQDIPFEVGKGRANYVASQAVAQRLGSGATNGVVTRT